MTTDDTTPGEGESVSADRLPKNDPNAEIWELVELMRHYVTTAHEAGTAGELGESLEAIECVLVALWDVLASEYGGREVRAVPTEGAARDMALAEVDRVADDLWAAGDDAGDDLRRTVERARAELEVVESMLNVDE